MRNRKMGFVFQANKINAAITSRLRLAFFGAEFFDKGTDGLQMAGRDSVEPSFSRRDVLVHGDTR